MQLRNLKMFFVCSALSLTACSFVKLNPKASNIFIAPNAQALSSCTDLGRTNVTLWSKAEALQSPEKIEEQLNTLARNSAANMGGNAVAPDSEIIGGQRTYRVYNCSSYQ